MNKHKQITIFPLPKHGGPLSFTKNLIKSIAGSGINISHNLKYKDNHPILLINGTRHMLSLLKCKMRGRRIVLRLGSPENLPSYLNFSWPIILKEYLIIKLLIFLRGTIADAVVYQSIHVKNEWNKLAVTKKREHIIYNGVNTSFFSPKTRKRENIILSVEGSQGADPFDIVINLHNELLKSGIDFKIIMLGKPCFNINKRVEKYERIIFLGEVSKSELQAYYRKSKCYLLTDYLGAGCPNALLEAIASGCVPLAFHKGPASEIFKNSVHGYLIDDTAKITKGEKISEFTLLAKKATNILQQHIIKSDACRQLAVEKYNLDTMRDKYLDVLFPSETGLN